MKTSLNTLVYLPSIAPKSRLQFFVKKTKYTVSLIFNRVMNCFCRRKWWSPIEGLKEKKISLGAIPLRRRLFRSDLDRLKAKGIQAVVCFVEPFERKRGIAGNPVSPEDLKNAGIECLFLPTPDFKPLKLNTLDDSADFIDKKTKERKHILSHCKAGRGRSAAGVCAYLIKHCGFTADDAIRYVRIFRKISLRFKQRAVLIEFQNNLQRKLLN